jgi:hypothetical protein
MPTPARRTLFRRDLFWPIAIAALIFLASSRSRVMDVGMVPESDKIAHFAVYGLLATLVCRLGHGWRAAAGALLVASLYGATDEWHQSFVPGRTPQVADWIADTVGAALAVGLYAGWTRYRNWLEKPLLRRARQDEKSGAPPKVAA